VALGPGWLSSVRQDLSAPAAAGSTSGNGASGSSPTSLLRSAPGTMHYVRVEFDRQIEGNSQIQDMRFSDHVRCVYGPVRRWEDTVADGTQSGPRAAELACDVLRVAQLRRSGKTGLQMEASGNTVIKGALFDARAERLTYDQLKQLMVFQGDPRSGAVVRFARDPRSDPATFTAGRILFWPETMNIDVPEFRSLSSPLPDLRSP
jgi:hypothetical protein